MLQVIYIHMLTSNMFRPVMVILSVVRNTKEKSLKFILLVV